jgi:ElaA protein
MINFKWYKFSDLTLEQLYNILALRAEVFVLGQQCIYQDPDGKDLDALHLVGTVDNETVAYLRLFPVPNEKNEIKFGRVLTKNSVRSKGYGKNLLSELLKYCSTHLQEFTVACSAQHYLQKFYESFGFKTIGEVYQEENIPHVFMRKE